MDKWLRNNAALIQQLQRLCADHGCSSGTAGHVVAYLLSVRELRRAAVHADLGADLVDAQVKNRLQDELPAEVASWAYARLYAP